jgi:hypothetical protein
MIEEREQSWAEILAFGVVVPLGLVLQRSFEAWFQMNQAAALAPYDVPLVMLERSLVFVSSLFLVYRAGHCFRLDPDQRPGFLGFLTSRHGGSDALFFLFLFVLVLQTESWGLKGAAGMAPAAEPGERFLTAPIRTGMHRDLTLGEVLIARRRGEKVGYTGRLVGRPGQRVVIDQTGVIVDGAPLEVRSPTTPLRPDLATTVELGPDQYLLLRDNRALYEHPEEISSRIYGRHELIARVVWRFAPRSRYGPIR